MTRLRVLPDTGALVAMVVFPRQRARAVDLIRPFLAELVRWPTPGEIAATLPHCADPADAPIFASALIARPDVMLANDFQAFHAPAAKAFWAQNGIEVESLCGLLCRLGRRERKG